MFRFGNIYRVLKAASSYIFLKWVAEGGGRCYNKAMISKREFMSVKEVAGRMGRSDKFVYGLVRTGRLDSCRLGRSWAISEADYQKYITSARSNRS